MTFQAGVVSNPNGRPKGSGHRQQLFNTLVEPHREALFKKAIDLALEGNEAMLRLFLDRMLPVKPTSESIQFDMPTGNFNSTETLNQLGEETMRAVAAGEITPEDASRIGAFLGVHQKTFQLIELRERFDAVEKIIKKDKALSQDWRK